MSRGSSPTSSVRVTCGVPLKVTMLTLSERWFTTHASVLLRAATATGSIPTGTRDCKVNPAAVMLKTSSAPLGVFTANRVVPSGDIAIGRTCPLSNSTNEGPADAPETEAGKNSAQVSAHRASSQSATAHLLILSIGSETRRIRGKLLFGIKALRHLRSFKLAGYCAPKRDWGRSLS